MKLLSNLDDIDRILDGVEYNKLNVRESDVSDGSGYIWFTNNLLIQWGRAVVTPSAANTVTSINVVYPKSYDNVPDVDVKPQVQYPNLVTTAVGMGTTTAAGRTSFLIYMTRTNTASTTFQWKSTGFKTLA